jgi:hypothetical protein
MPPVDSAAVLSTTRQRAFSRSVVNFRCNCCCIQFLEGLSGWRRRWTMVLLCFVAFMLCNMDRVNMSIAVLPMAQQYGWSTQTVGLVQSSFFW